MQKFKGKLKNAPTNVLLICSSVNSLLNRVEKLSAKSRVLPLNSLEGDYFHLKGVRT